MRNVTIEIQNAEKIYQALDMYEGATITLNCISNLLSSVADITCSVSQTIKVPHTVTNDRILDMATSPSYDSTMTYRKVPCRCQVDGIDMVGDAWCYITDCDKDAYEIVITFGLMQDLGTWLDADPSLRDLAYDADDYILWNGKSANQTWIGGTSHCFPSSGNPYPGAGSIFFGLYDYGVERNATTLAYCNVSPFTTMREVWERIIQENSLDFTLPRKVLYDMENNAIVLTKNNNKQATLQEEILTMVNKPLTVGKATDTVRRWQLRVPTQYEDYFDNVNSAFIHKGEEGVRIHINDIYMRCTKSGYGFYFTNDILANPQNYTLVINGIGSNNSATIAPVANGGNGVKYTVDMDFVIDEDYIENGWAILDIYIRSTKLPSFPDNVWQSPWNAASNPVGWEGGLDSYIELSTSAAFSSVANFASYVYYEGTTSEYSEGTGINFELVRNLPDISQIDFVKAVCQHYGLFPVVSSTGGVDFVPFSVLTDNIEDNSVDWSDKLVGTGKFSPEHINFTLADYAKRNSFGYKEDTKELHPHRSVAYIEVDNELLNKEAKLVEFPWAASSGNKITQYQMNDEGDGVE